MFPVGQRLGEEGGEVLVGVGHGLAEIHDIPIVVELVLERQRVVGGLTRLLPQFLALPILHLRPFPRPANLPLLPPHHRKHARLHAALKQRIALRHVHNIHANGGPLWHTSDTEKEPLVVAFCVDVVLQDEVVLV